MSANDALSFLMGVDTTTVENQSYAVPKPSLTKTDSMAQWDPLIDRFGVMYPTVPKNIVRSMIAQKLSGNPNATGPMTWLGHARGLGQFVDETARRFVPDWKGPQDSYNPEKNIHGMFRYLTHLIQKNNGDVNAAVGRYFGHGTDPTGQTTGRYVKEVMERAGMQGAQTSRSRDAINFLFGSAGANTPADLPVSTSIENTSEAVTIPNQTVTESYPKNPFQQSNTVTIADPQVITPLDSKEMGRQELLRDAASSKNFTLLTNPDAIGGVIKAQGKLYQREPEKDPEYNNRYTRGEEIAKRIGIDMKAVRYSGTVPLITPKMKQGLQQYEVEDLYTYLTEQKRQQESSTGKAIEQFGQQFSDMNRILDEPRKQNFQNALIAIEQKKPGIAKSLRMGDIQGAVDQYTFDAFISGNEDAIRNAMSVRDQMDDAGAKNRDMEKSIGEYDPVAPLVFNTAQMLPMMAKGMVVSSVPVLGPALSTSMWAQQGAGELLADMERNGVPRDIAIPMALSAGLAYAQIEKLQIKQISNIDPIKKAINNPIKAHIKGLVLQKGKDWVMENMEEIAQTIVQKRAVDVALDKAGIKKDSGDLISRYKDDVVTTFKESAGPMGLLSLLGLGAGTLKTIANRPGTDATTTEMQITDEAGNPVSGKTEEYQNVERENAQVQHGNIPVGKRLADFGVQDQDFWTLPEEQRNEIYPQLSETEQDRLQSIDVDVNSSDKVRQKVTAVKRDATEKEEIANVELEPTDGQKSAGNYRKAHIAKAGFDVSIENPAGSIRKGVSPEGVQWETPINHDYGYIRGTKGADGYRNPKSGDQVDVFINPNVPLENSTVYVVNQKDPKTGAFDEHKVMMGFDSEQAATDAYRSNYAPDWQGFDSVITMPIEDFRKWVYSGATQYPATKNFVEDTKKFGTKQNEKIYSEDPPANKPVLQSVVKNSEQEIAKRTKGLQYVLQVMSVKSVEEFSSLSEAEQAVRFQRADKVMQSSSKMAPVAADGILELNRILDLIESSSSQNQTAAQANTSDAPVDYIGREVLFNGPKGNVLNGIIISTSSDGKRATVERIVNGAIQQRIVPVEQITKVDGVKAVPKLFPVKPIQTTTTESAQVYKEQAETKVEKAKDPVRSKEAVTPTLSIPDSVYSSLLEHLHKKGFKRHIKNSNGEYKFVTTNDTPASFYDAAAKYLRNKGYSETSSDQVKTLFPGTEISFGTTTTMKADVPGEQTVPEGQNASVPPAKQPERGPMFDDEANYIEDSTANTLDNDTNKVYINNNTTDKGVNDGATDPIKSGQNHDGGGTGVLSPGSGDTPGGATGDTQESKTGVPGAGRPGLVSVDVDDLPKLRKKHVKKVKGGGYRLVDTEAIPEPIYERALEYIHKKKHKHVDLAQTKQMLAQDKVFDGFAKDVINYMFRKPYSAHSRSETRKYAKPKKHLPKDKYTSEYHFEEWAHGVRIDFINNMIGGFTVNGKTYNGKHETYKEDIAYVTDTTDITIKDKFINKHEKDNVSAVAHAYLASIRDHHQQEQESLDFQNTYGKEAPPEVSVLISYIQNSKTEKEFLEYHRTYEKDRGYLSPKSKKEQEKEKQLYLEAEKVFSEDPKKLTAEQVKILEDSWNESIAVRLEKIELERQRAETNQDEDGVDTEDADDTENALSPDQDSDTVPWDDVQNQVEYVEQEPDEDGLYFAKSRDVNQMRLDLLDGATVEQQQEMDLFSQNWKPEKERTPQTQKFSDETEDLFAGTSFEDTRSKTQKEIDKHRQDKEQARTLGVEGLPLFDKNEQEAMATEQQNLFSEKPIANSNKIEDFGDKIGGARKDYYADYADTFERAKDKDIGSVPLSESWPQPDYQKLIENGVDPYIVGFVRAAREEVPTRPQKSWKLRRFVEEVTLLRDISEKLLSGTISKEKLSAYLQKPEFQSLNGSIGGRASLYVAVGHDKSLKGISMTGGRFSYYKGKNDVDMWIVRNDGTNKSFPYGTVAEGTSPDAATEAFKSVYDSLSAVSQSKSPSFDIFQNRITKKFFIGKKVGTNYAKLMHFDTLAEARHYLKENTDKLEALFEKYKTVPNERRAFNRERIGKDHRSGNDVTPQDFTAAFGFRGVEFGNWLNNQERQQSLNQAYDALHDLATILNIPTQGLSLDGQLGLAFGARGHGGKNAPSAHYEPVKVVINLTKKSGPGSLAHEWWHAFDAYIAKSSKIKATYTTDTNEYTRDASEIRRELSKAFGMVMKSINSTKLRDRSNELDTRRSKPYWATNIEMSARSFENYVIEKLNDMGATNDYLANIITNAEYAKDLVDVIVSGENPSDSMYPYLLENEIPEVKSQFDALFTTIKTRTTDQGVALYAKVDRQGQTDGRRDDLNMYESDKPGDQRIAERVTGAVLRSAKVENYEGERGIVILDPSRGTPDAQKITTWLEQLTGKKISWFSSSNDLESAIGFSPDGISFPKNMSSELSDRIFININNDRPMLWIAGHELWHFVEQNPDFKRQLWNALSVTEKGKQKIEQLQGMYEGKLDTAQSEFVADIVGEMITDSKFWAELQKNDQNVFQKVLTKLIEILSKMSKSFRNAFMGDPKAGRQYESMIANVEDVRNTLARILREYKGGKMTGPDAGAAIGLAMGQMMPVEGVVEPAYAQTATENPQIYTEEFKRWFGDWENDPENASKVVDEDGKPLVVYHGRTMKFEGAMPTPVRGNLIGAGYYTNSLDVAKSYSLTSTPTISDENIAAAKESAGDKYDPTITSAHLSIKNPIENDDTIYMFFTTKELIADLEEYDSSLGYALYLDKKQQKEELNKVLDRFVPEYTGSSLPINLKRLFGYIEEFPAQAEVLKKEYDGVIYEDLEAGGTTYIPFFPNQIKSATDNTGTFDPANDDIRFAKSTRPNHKVNAGPKQDKSPLAETEDVQQAKKDMEAQKEKIAAMETIINRLRGSLRHVPEHLLLDRAEIELKIKSEKMDEIEQIKNAILDYAKKIGIEGVAYNKVGAQVGAAKTVRGLERAVDVLDKVYAGEERRQAVDALNTALEKEYRRLSAIASGKRKSTIAPEYNVMLKNYLDQLTGKPGGEEFDHKAWVDKMLAYYNNYAKADMRKAAALDGLPDDVINWMEDPSKPVPDKISKAIKYLFKQSVESMTTEQVTQVLDDIESIKNTGRTVQQAEEIERKIALDRKAGAGAEVIAAATPEPGEETFAKVAKKHRLTKWEWAGKLGEKGFWSLIDPERMVEWLSGFKNVEVLKNGILKPFYDAEARKLKNLEAAQHAFEKRHEKLDMKEMTTEQFMEIDLESFYAKHNVALKGKTGQVALTFNQGMFIYANSKNPGNRAHLEGMFVNSNVANDVIDLVVEKLPDVYKSIVDEQIRYYDNVQYPRMNAVFKREHGVDLPKEANYFPIQSVKTDRAESAIVADYLARFSSRWAGVQKGMTKMRVHSKAPFMQMSYIDAVVKNTLQSEHYIAYNDAVREVQQFVNHPMMREAMETKNEEVYRQLKDWIKAVAYGKVGGSEHPLDKAFDFMRSNFSTYALGLRLTTSLQQFASLPRGMAMLDKKSNLLKSASLFMKDPIAALDFAAKKSGLMASRASSYERELAEMAEKQSVGQFTGLTSLSDKVKNIAMYHIGITDRMVATLLWNARYQESIDAGMTEWDAISVADELIRKTQSRGGVLYMPSIYRGPGLARAFLMFTSDINQSVNLLFYMAHTWKMKPTQENLTEAALYFIVPTFVIWLVNNALRFDEPEDYAKEFVRQFSGAVPLFGQVIDAATMSAVDGVKEARGLIPDRRWRNYAADLAPAPMSLIENTVEGIAYGRPLNLLETAAQVAGLPYAAPKQMVSGVKRVSEGENWRALIWGKGKTRDNSVFDSMARRALKPRPKSNDTEVYSKWYRSLSKEKKDQFRRFLQTYNKE